MLAQSSYSDIMFVDITEDAVIGVRILSNMDI